MVLHRAAPRNPHTLRLVGFAVAYTFAMVTGTALLIATFSAFDDDQSVRASNAAPVEVAVQQTNDKRGY